MTIRFGNVSAGSTLTVIPKGAALVSAGGLGTMALQNSNAVAVTGGSISGASLASSNVSLTGGSISGSCVASSALSSTAVTIGGGTVSNTPIGATAASSADFTTVGMTSSITVGLFATTAAPAYAKGKIYFDTTLNKLRVGGATTWETITST